jgi:hypothetical protein
MWLPSPNYSSRGGAGVRLIVLHTAEGARTIESLGGWFAQSSSQVSSHVGADDKPNTVGEYVHRPDKAWTQSSYNPVAVSIEMCAFAAWSTAEWHQHPNILANCAKWIAEEAAHYGLPITRLSDAQAQGSGRGVCDHYSLGPGGGGHSDVGPGFPWEEVLELARAGGEPLPPPAEATDLQTVRNKDGRLEAFAEQSDGEVWHAWQKTPGGGWGSWATLGTPGK